MATEQRLLGTATGSVGSLFATVRVRGREDMSLPCVLSYWFNQFAYDDPLGGMDLAKTKPWHDAIRDLKQVVMTQDEVTSPEGSECKTFRRIGYIGVFAISDIEIEGNHLRFTRDRYPLLRLE